MAHGSDSRRETAEYIADMAGELAQIAGQQEFEVLRYLLEMAWQEARSLAQQNAETFEESSDE